MQFAIWDRNTNMRPSDLANIGRIQPILYTQAYSADLNMYLNSSVELKYHNCKAEDIEAMGPGIEDYAGPSIYDQYYCLDIGQKIGL